MKTKTWLKISAFSTIPLMMITLLFGSIGISYYFGGNILGTFLSGHANNGFVAILSVISLLCISVILTTATIIVRYGDKIDDLDKEIGRYNEEKRKYEAATRKFVEKQ